MSVWTINGETTDALKVTSLRRRQASQAPAMLTLQQAIGLDEVAYLTYGDEVSVRKDDQPWFAGVVTSVRRRATAREEYIVYEAQDAWWYLDRLVYQQNWQLAGGPGRKSRIVIGQNDAGERIDSGEIIREVLSYAAAANGVPGIFAGEIGVDVDIPWHEMLDATCGEIIRAVLRWSPDAVAYFTPGTYKFNVRRRSECPLVTFDAMAGKRLTHFEAEPCPHLVVPAVVIKYERVDEFDGTQRNTLVTDAAPVGATGMELGALVFTVELAGSRVTSQTQNIRTDNLPPADVSLLTTWLLGKMPALGEKDDFEITDISANYIYPKELLEGEIQDWMTGVNQAEGYIGCAASWTEPDGTKMTNVPIAVRFRCTDALQERYTRYQTEEVGEPQPEGIAAKLYSALSVLHHEGSLSMVEDEVTGSVQVGNRVSISNVPGLSNMTALVQVVDEDVESGKTQIRFGPPSQISPQDFVELLRPNRMRGGGSRYSAERNSSTPSSGGAVETGAPGVLENGSTAGGGFEKLVVKSDAKTITLDPAQVQCGAEVALMKIMALTADGVSVAQVVGSLTPCSESHPWSLIEIEICDGETTRTITVLGKEA
jgi:hypothetical protein